MKRQVSIYIEKIADSKDYFELELFNDEKISINSSLQDVNDLSKIKTDFSQAFTIPCSNINNQIFNHFYENNVENNLLFQNRFNAYIEIGKSLFRKGKIQFEKSNLKKGKPYSYSISFFGAGLSLKDIFLDYKLSDLNYSLIDHSNSLNVIRNRIVNTLTFNLDVGYPLISNLRVWQYNGIAPIPTQNTPEWYDWSTQNTINDISSNATSMYTSELFPAVRVRYIMQAICLFFNIKFKGLNVYGDFTANTEWIKSNVFESLFLYFKNKQESNGNIISTQNLKYTTMPSFPSPWNYNTIEPPPNNARLRVPIAPELGNTWVIKKLYVSVTNITNLPQDAYLDIYLYGSLYTSVLITGINNALYNTEVGWNTIFSFKTRALTGTNLSITLKYEAITYVNNSAGVPTVQNTYTSNANCQILGTTLTNIQSFAPDMKIIDFINGLCRQFNLTIYTENAYDNTTFVIEPISNWLAKGKIRDITKYVSTDDIEISKVKLFKNISFKFAESESFINKYFEQNIAPTGKPYGNINQSYDIDGTDYNIETPFENLLQQKFTSTYLQVGYCLNKEFAPYVPKPILLYLYGNVDISSSPFYLNNTLTTKYNLFGQDALLQTPGTLNLINYTLNFASEISSFLNVPIDNTVFKNYYFSYLDNLYRSKNRLVKVKCVLPLGMLLNLKLNDRIIIRGKKYIINNMVNDLTNGESELVLLQDFAEVRPSINLQLNNPAVNTPIILQLILGDDDFNAQVTSSSNYIQLNQNNFNQSQEYTADIIVANYSPQTVFIYTDRTTNQVDKSGSLIINRTIDYIIEVL